MPAEPTPNTPRESDRNPDPITGEPGAHPVGTGVGAAAGGATGAAIGSAVGPIGTAIGAVVGAVVGGLAGKGVAEMIDPTAEDTYWREKHWSQPYADRTRPYEAYAPAYRAGVTGYREGQTFEEREAELRMEYEGRAPEARAGAGLPGGDPAPKPGAMPRDSSTDPVRDDDARRAAGAMQSQMSALRWGDAREAARAAYERVRRGEAQRVNPEAARD